MAQQTINIGAAPNDDTGDDLRTGGQKINDNFTELYGMAGGSGSPFDIPVSYAGGPPTTGEILYAVVVPRTLELAADLAGSYGYIGTNPTASFAISVQDDGTEIGTITISAAGAFTFATDGGTAKTVAAGSRLEFVAPVTVDTTAAYILATLAGAVG